EATYLFLCAYSKNENHKVKKTRKKIQELFENQTLKIDEVTKLKLPQYMDIEKIFLKILSQTRSYKRAWKNFPYKFTSLFKEAYRSYKFNEQIANFIKSIDPDHFLREYTLTIPEEFKNLTQKFPDRIELVYPKKTINTNNLELNLEGNKRNIFSNPIIYWYEITKDEVFQDYQKLNLSFFLLKGEFATNLLNFLLEDLLLEE
ncbi:MAG: tRNA pseudouridine(13) synthase TruD, partial [bacterium]